MKMRNLVEIWNFCRLGRSRRTIQDRDITHQSSGVYLNGKCKIYILKIQCKCGKKNSSAKFSQSKLFLVYFKVADMFLLVLSGKKCWYLCLIRWLVQVVDSNDRRCWSDPLLTLPVPLLPLLYHHLTFTGIW